MAPPSRRTALTTRSPQVVSKQRTPARRGSSGRPASSATRPARRAAETQRLRLHFDRVLGLLRARDVSDWPTQGQEARSRTLRMIEEYRDAGRFPVNRHRPGFSPVFQDDDGALCAMGHVASRWGRADIVAWVRANDNHVRLALHVPPIIAAWLPETGLDPVEAALVQPSYSCSDPHWGRGCSDIDVGPAPTAAPPANLPVDAVGSPAWMQLALATALVLIPLAPLSYLALRNAWNGAFVWGTGGALAQRFVIGGSAIMGASMAVGLTRAMG